MGHIIHLTDIETFKASGKVRKLRKAVSYRSQGDLVPDWKVGAAAADALARLGDAGAVKPLIGALEDERPEVREAAAQALGRLTARDAVEPLIRTAGGPRGSKHWRRLPSLTAFGGRGTEMRWPADPSPMDGHRESLCTSGPGELRGPDLLPAAVGRLTRSPDRARC